MKKIKGMFVAGMASMMVAAGNVHATNLTEKIVVGNADLGNSIQFKKTYDEEKDINNVLVTLLVDKDSINTVLNQASGVGSYQSVFYFSLHPNLESVSGAVSFRKQAVWLGSDLTNKTLDAALKALAPKVASEKSVGYSEVWPNALSVEYFDGTEWVVSDTQSAGKTIKADLMDKLELTKEDELVYGENFRFSMYDEYQQLWGWDILNAAGESLGTETVAVDWEIKFPVSAKLENEQVMYISVEDALAANETEIIINADTEVKGDLTIPKGVKLVVADGATLTVPEGSELTNNGIISGAVVVGDEERVYNLVNSSNTTNGSFTVDKNTSFEGDTVTVTPTAKDGYELSEIIVTTADGETVKVDQKTGEFVMPDGEVQVKVTFKAKASQVAPTPEVPSASPPTSDNILVNVGLLAISAGAFAVATKKLKKFN